ncbi:hypothetical protein BU16DRAFT_230729 [Lophium mytilinum]|uniref:ASST-domain-containing protein n=1 Tax=Lophium mytilinum TaxID=390894 RepID=A0A6A6Q7M8_9PEZI|nr:hypothetical protein BU16DRAFT_230729 [Lophium mytilinum]
MYGFAIPAAVPWLLAAVLANDNISEPTSTYFSNSEIENGFAPGYIFIAPYGPIQRGPYIYNKFGDLVWSGYDAAYQMNNTMDHKVCTYDGSDHLCMWRGSQKQGYGLGDGIIMNSSYQIVKTVACGNGKHADIHEFNLINGGKSALFTAYNWFQYDLAAFNITGFPTWIMQGVFQEVEVETGTVLFEWSSIDHVSPANSYVAAGSSDVSGNGSAQAPWDYFHINAVDKSSATGRYLISARHTSSVYLISPDDGSIIWQLSSGGPGASFTSSGFNFSFQHDARFILENSTHTIISLFDNASNGFNRTATESSGMVIAINLDTKAATLVSQTFAPTPGGILSDSQGNSQVLASGGVFHGWGSFPAISETNAAGEAVLYATFGAYPVMNYRAYTAPWVATPNDKPALIAQPQQQNASTALNVYISWNGATEVQSWRLWGSTSDSGPFHILGNVTKKGFETHFTHANYSSFIFAEAVGGSGESWANSSVVPVDSLRRNGTTVIPSSVPESSSVASSNSMSSTALATVVPGETAATTVTTPDSTATGPAPVATTSSTAAALAQEAGPVGKTLALCIAVGVMFVFV